MVKCSYITFSPASPDGTPKLSSHNNQVAEIRSSDIRVRLQRNQSNSLNSICIRRARYFSSSFNHHGTMWMCGVDMVALCKGNPIYRRPVAGGIRQIPIPLRIGLLSYTLSYLVSEYPLNGLDSERMRRRPSDFFYELIRSPQRANPSHQITARLPSCM